MKLSVWQDQLTRQIIFSDKLSRPILPGDRPIDSVLIGYTSLVIEEAPLEKPRNFKRPNAQKWQIFPPNPLRPYYVAAKWVDHVSDQSSWSYIEVKEIVPGEYQGVTEDVLASVYCKFMAGQSKSLLQFKAIFEEELALGKE